MYGCTACFENAVSAAGKCLACGIDYMKGQRMKDIGKAFDAAAQQHSAAIWRDIIVGKRFKHWKGDIYIVMSVDVDEATGDVRVAYASQDHFAAPTTTTPTARHPFIWSRTIDNFTCEVVPGVKRFVLVETGQ